MPGSRKMLIFAAILAMPLAALGEAAASADSSSAVALAQKQIGTYLERLGDLHCTETVTQEKLGEKGRVQGTERGTFDYLIMMSGDADDFQLNESRIENKGTGHKPVAMPMLVTNGIATVLLVFHPYYRDAFVFKTGPAEMVDGEPAIPIHFTHIPGRRTPAALALRGRDYPLDLEGTAWLDEASSQVVQVEAGLERDMSDVGLRSLNIKVEYKPELLSGKKSEIDLPAVAVVDVTTPRQHWRNTHVFSDYRSFSTGAQQSSSVKIITGKNGSSDNQTPASSPQVPEKQP
jgi:hypothetical protein